jgi:uncharacterized protein YbjT (DUF2867 family)
MVKGEADDNGSKQGGGIMILITVVPPNKGEGTSPTELVGRCLVNQLLKAGKKVRVLAGGQQVHNWPEGVQIVNGNIAHSVESHEVFQGIERVFLAGANAKTIKEYLVLAKRANVQRFVVLSSHGPEYEINYPPETWFWLAIEKAVEQSGMEWTHIRPSAVMGGMFEGSYPATGSGWQESIRKEGIVREPYINTGYYPFIHEDDLAAVASAALLEDKYLGKILEAVNVPISTMERVHLISKAIGREILTEELTPDQARKHWRSQGWPDETIEVTLYALEEYGKHPDKYIKWTVEQRPSVEQMIGRPVRTYGQWVAEHVNKFK